jgi:hypothetical protein
VGELQASVLDGQTARRREMILCMTLTILFVIEYFTALLLLKE